jgi:hypothetical protein
MSGFHEAYEAEQHLAIMISSEVEAFMMLHEQADHNGAICMDERINTLAWIAHRCGIKSDQVGQIVTRLAEWEEHHKENHAGH